MQGRTHMPLGIAAAAILVPAASIPALTAGVGAAAIGGVLPDIDAGQSGPHRDAAVISGVCVLILGVLAFAEWRWKLGIWRIIRQRTNSPRMILGFLALLALSIYGMHQPHRGFMHSIAALAALSACVGVILPPAAPYFTIAYASHIAADLLNRRGEQLLWPLHHRWSLDLCPSDGFVNHILCLASTACAVLAIIIRIYFIIH